MLSSLSLLLYLLQPQAEKNYRNHLPRNWTILKSPPKIALYGSGVTNVLMVAGTELMLPLNMLLVSESATVDANHPLIPMIKITMIKTPRLKQIWPQFRLLLHPLQKLQLHLLIKL
jgi:hypothetical protein